MTFPVSRHAALTALALAIAAPCALAEPSAVAPADTVVVTATRSPQLARDVLSDTLVIGAEEIARSGAASLIDLLQRQRGIEVSRNGGAGSASSVFIRGANGQQNIVLVDGVRIGSSTLGSANWSAVPLSSIDHVEIVYGPLSTLYGADAIGGVVQIFTKRGAGAPSLSAFAGAGSDALREYNASVSGATGGEHSFSYALSAGQEKSDGISSTKPGNFSYNPDKDGYDRQSAAGQFALQLNQGYELGLVFLQSRLKAQYDNGPSDYDARSVEKLENLAVFSTFQITPTWTFQAQLAQASDKSANNGGAETWDKSQLNTRQTDFTVQNDIKIGGDMLQILYDHRNENVTSNDTPELQRERSTESFAAAYNLTRGPQLASLSLRNDNSSQYGSKTTGAAGYGYRISSALRASASVGTSFRAPTFNELYYPGYGVPSNQPEKGRNIETGLHFDDGSWQLGAVYYHNRLTDLLVSTATCPAATAEQPYPYGCAYNINKALLEGLTLSAQRSLGDFHLSGSVDLQNPRDETTGKTLVRRAKKHADFAAQYNVGALAAGLEWQLSGQRFDDAANTKTLGGYGLINLFATYQLARDWSLLLRWNNATGKQYELAGNYATPGAKVFAGLRYGIK
ncbi:vitamin B12 transporter [Oxalobacteraceae bacterium GrIS 1.11]